MMNKFERIALELSDGSLAIMSFVTLGRGPVVPPGGFQISEKKGLWMREPRPEIIELELAKAFPGVARDGSPLPTVVSWFIIDAKQIPTDRTYRNAWVGTNGKDGITHDMPKAREYHRTLLRHERGDKLAALDAKWMRATGRGNKAEQDAVEAERQKWRDAPADPRIDAAQSVEELKQIKVI